MIFILVSKRLPDSLLSIFPYSASLFLFFNKTIEYNLGAQIILKMKFVMELVDLQQPPHQRKLSFFSQHLPVSNHRQCYYLGMEPPPLILLGFYLA